MYLIHESTIKNYDGTIEIALYIVNDKVAKKYTYVLSSEWAARQFHRLYRRKSTHGKALSVLNKFKIKETPYDTKEKL